MLRVVKIVLTATVATFGFISGIFDHINWSNTVGAVGIVTSMATAYRYLGSILLIALFIASKEPD